MFRPFGPQFGPKIRWWGRAPRSPPLNPPLLFKLEYFGNKKRDSGNRCQKVWDEFFFFFFAKKDLVFPDAEHRPLCTQRRSVCNTDHPIDRKILTKKQLLKYYRRRKFKKSLSCLFYIIKQNCLSDFIFSNRHNSVDTIFSTVSRTLRFIISQCIQKK